MLGSKGLIINYSLNSCIAENQENLVRNDRGRSRTSGKGVRMYKGMGISFADFISFFLHFP